MVTSPFLYVQYGGSRYTRRFNRTTWNNISITKRVNTKAYDILIYMVGIKSPSYPFILDNNTSSNIWMYDNGIKQFQHIGQHPFFVSCWTSVLIFNCPFPLTVDHHVKLFNGQIGIWHFVEYQVVSISRWKTKKKTRRIVPWFSTTKQHLVKIHIEYLACE